MAFAPTKPWKLPFITTWGGSPNRNLPTNSAEEARKARDRNPVNRRRQTVSRTYRRTGQEHRQCARLSCLDAVYQGGGQPAAHCPDDAGGERSGRAARFARPVGAGQQGT